MREPLFGIDLMRWARRVEVRPGDDAGDLQVVIIQQVYDSLVAQENIAHLCRQFARDAGVRIFTVEGAQGTITPACPGDTVETLIRRPVNDVSAGVLLFAGDAAPDVAVAGVDDAILKSRQQEYQQALIARKDEVQSTFAQIRRLVRGTQAGIYSREFAALRDDMTFTRATEEGMPVAKKFEIAAQYMKVLYIDIDDFPSIASLFAAMQMQRSISNGKVSGEWAAFCERIIKGVSSWYQLTPPNVVNIDIALLEPLLLHWFQVTGVDADEWVSLFKSGDNADRERAVLQCKNWYENWLFHLALPEALASALEDVPRHEELMRLALLARIPYFDLVNYRRFVAVQRLQGSQPLQRAGAELTVLCRAIARRLKDPRAAQLFELEEQLGDLYRSAVMELSPADFDPSEALGEVPAVVREVAGLVGATPPNDLLHRCACLADVMRMAWAFAECSVRRGQHMALETVNVMRDRREGRAVLVAGGFHTQALTRSFEDERRIAWSIVSPAFDVGRYLRGQEQAGA